MTIVEASNVGVKVGMVGKGVTVDVGGMGVCVAVGTNEGEEVGAGSADCVCEGPHAESASPRTKSRERTFFIVHLAYLNGHTSAGT